jgi:hypothetical protein
VKKAAVAVAVLIFAALMVLPVMRSVNLSAGKPVTIGHAMSADGWPEPPFPPKAQQTLVADGWPEPPFPPKAQQTLVADGWPEPPFPPKAQQTLVADGWPEPPFPPRSAEATVRA